MRTTGNFLSLTYREPRQWPAWLPMLLFAGCALRWAGSEPWLFMWAIALALWAGCKWMVLWRVTLQNGCASLHRVFGFLFLWIGMDAESFLDESKTVSRPLAREWFAAVGKTIFGVVLVWGVVPRLSDPLTAGWVGLIGFVFILHFGLFHVVALAWQKAGVCAEPIMNQPARATSLAEFWSQRWNAAFNQLAFGLVFRPLVRRIGVAGATMAAFLGSGIVHDVVISMPARGGYGLPTAYFVVQGFGLLFERSKVGRAMGLQTGFRGWLFMAIVTAPPAYWLFHPPFIREVIVPFLRALGAMSL